MDDCTPVYSIAVPMHLLSDREVSATAKLLYGVIDSFQKKSGVCYASNSRLAEEIAGCSERTISRSVGELKSAGYIIVDEGKSRKIYLTTSVVDGQEGRQKCLPTATKMSRGVDKTGEGGRQNCLPSITVSNTNSKTEKKTIDPLPVFVDWIRTTFPGSDPDRMNLLYKYLVAYKEMRSDSKSPLNTKRKVDGLLADLYDGSHGDLDAMCEMLKVSTRRCWLSVHPLGGQKFAAAPPQNEREYKCV